MKNNTKLLLGVLGIIVIALILNAGFGITGKVTEIPPEEEPPSLLDRIRGVFGLGDETTDLAYTADDSASVPFQPDTTDTLEIVDDDMMVSISDSSCSITTSVCERLYSDCMKYSTGAVYSSDCLDCSNPFNLEYCSTRPAGCCCAVQSWTPNEDGAIFSADCLDCSNPFNLEYCSTRPAGCCCAVQSATPGGDETLYSTCAELYNPAKYPNLYALCVSHGGIPVA